MTDLKWTQKPVDFANVFKAFIGSSYLSMPFAFRQSGIIFGVVLLLIVGWLTDFCSNQMVRCKAIVISRLMEEFQIKLDNGLLPNIEAELFRSGKLRSRWENRMTLGHIAKYAYGKKAQWVVSICLFVSQFGFCVGYFVFIGNTIKELLNYRPQNDTHGTNISHLSYLDVSGGSTSGYDIPLSYLVMVPLPLFILFSMLRTVRNIGWISAIATFTVAFGFFSVLGLLLNGFTLNPSFLYVNWSTIPIVFGLLTCAFEGIGTVIPIESSMVGNRHNFPNYLHISMVLMVIILGSFGIIGHLRYGIHIHQIVLQNIPNSIFVSIVNCVLILGVLCTYPLQMFPVSEIAEFLIFRKTSADFNRERNNQNNSHQAINQGDYKDATDIDELVDELSVQEDETEELTQREWKSEDETKPKVAGSNYGTIIPEEAQQSQNWTMSSTNSVFTKKEERMIRIIHGSKITAPAWKRNCIRAVLVLFQLGLAVAMRNNYAYLNAFIGAIGCSFLAYILPAATYYKLTKGNRRWYGCGDILIIVFGVVGTVTSFTVTVLALVKPEWQ